MDVGLRTMILNRNMSVCGWHFTDFYSQLFHFVLLMFWTNIFFNILVLSSSLSYDWNVHIIEWCVCLRHHHRITDSNGDVLRCTNLLSMIGDLKLCTSYIVPIWLEVQHFCIWLCTWAIQFHEFQWNAYAYTHTHTCSHMLRTNAQSRQQNIPPSFCFRTFNSQTTEFHLMAFPF